VKLAGEVERRILDAAAKAYLERGFESAIDIRSVIGTAPPSALRNIGHVRDGNMPQ
jgi:hypothetical protein